MDGYAASFDTAHPAIERPIPSADELDRPPSLFGRVADQAFQIEFGAANLFGMTDVENSSDLRIIIEGRAVHRPSTVRSQQEMEHRRFLRRSVRSSAVGLAVLLSLPALAVQAATGDWPTYHRDNFRDGNAVSAPFNGPLLRRWTSAPVGDTIYAEPLLVGNLLIVADLSDTITAFNAGTGGIVWQTTVGNPVTPTTPPFLCGNVSPLGILGTPVADPNAGIVYAVAMEQPANYYLVGLDLKTGRARFPQVAIAPAGFDPHIQQQRTALTLANGYVYAGFGGYAGDCGAYHGWVVGVPASGSGAQVVFHDNPRPTATEAGFWATAGASVDGSGNLYITSGNGSSCGGSFDNGNTIFKLSPTTLGLVDWWAPSVWNSLNCSDTDLGSVGPAIVGTSGNLVFQVGKSGWGYLLNTALSSPGGNIGNAPFAGRVCSAATTETAAFDQVFGSVAYADPYIYVPCPEGIVALKLAAGPSFSRAWTSASINPGPPIVAGGVVWAINTSNGSLYGLNATTGATRFSALSLGPTTHFSTPTAGLGRIYVPIGDQVIAFGQPRAELAFAVPSKAATTRGSPPPRVPQVPAGPRPLIPSSSQQVSLLAYPSPALGGGSGWGQWREPINALMRRIVEVLLAHA